MKKAIPIIRILIIVCFLIVIIVIPLYKRGAFTTDYSAKLDDGLYWKDRHYSDFSRGEYTESKTVAKTEDRKWNIVELKEDPSHTFVVVRSFLDNYLYVADDYTVPTSGKVTKAAWAGEYIENSEFINAITAIDGQKVTSFEYQTESISALNDTQRMKSLYFAYEGCPITTEFRGYLGKINGEWVITTEISPDRTNEDGSPKVHTVGCYSIPQEYHSVLEKYYFE